MKHVLNSPAANGFHLADLKFHGIAHLVIGPNSELRPFLTHRCDFLCY